MQLSITLIKFLDDIESRKCCLKIYTENAAFPEDQCSGYRFNINSPLKLLKRDFSEFFIKYEKQKVDLYNTSKNKKKVKRKTKLNFIIFCINRKINLAQFFLMSTRREIFFCLIFRQKLRQKFVDLIKTKSMVKTEKKHSRYMILIWLFFILSIFSVEFYILV